VRRWKTFGTEFWKLYHKGSFYQKRKIAQKVQCVATSGRHDSAVITNAENSRRSGPHTGYLVSIFTVRINSKSFSWAVRPKRSAICNRCFPGPTRVVDANGISIASAVFVGLTRWQTDWQTDRPRYSVGNNRRSAHWRSQILLLSMATTSIYWSSRPVGWSDQLQQSEAIFSCKTRLVAMYMKTHYNIASKRAFPTGVPHR